MTDEKDILAMFEKIQSDFKHVDILINNAGVGLPDDLLTGQTDKWRQMLEVYNDCCYSMFIVCSLLEVLEPTPEKPRTLRCFSSL